MKTRLVTGKVDTRNVVTGKVSTSAGSTPLEAVVAALGLPRDASATAIRAALESLLQQRVEAGARQLGLSPKAARALASMKEQPRKDPRR